MERGLSPEAEYDVMEATRDVLGREGFSGLTLDEVADRAEASERVYANYESPVEIATAFVDYERDRFEEFLMVTADEPNLRLRALLDVLVGLVDVDDDDLVPAYLEMYAQAAEYEELRESLLAFDEAIHDALAETIRDGIEDGTFSEVDPEAAAAIIYAVHMSTFLRKAVGADTTPIRDALDHFVLSTFRQ
ncbi:MAG: AcrR family transcriptional regulator [Natronomonas sp.]|jgi:AcrR family transcriptional regulator